MENIFIKQYDLRTNDFDRFDNIKISSVLDLFQDSAGRHSEKIGAGLLEMREKEYFWVLVKIKLKILKKPRFHQRVNLKTWPLKPNRFIYRREYIIEDESGDAMIIGSSEWVVLDSKKRCLVSNADIYSLDDEFLSEVNFEKRLEKIGDFEAEVPFYTVVPQFSQIDANNHTNNTKYADFIIDAINPDENFDIDTFSIEYKKEVLVGEELNIFCKRQEKMILAKGVNKNGENSFLSKITYK